MLISIARIAIALGCFALSLSVMAADKLPDWLLNSGPTVELKQLEQRSSAELKLLQTSRFRLKEPQFAVVSQKFKETLNQQRILAAWQNSLQQALADNKVASLAHNPVLQNPLLIEMENRLQSVNWQSADYLSYQKKLQQQTLNPERYALVQALVAARGQLVFEINLNVKVRKQLLLTVAKVAKKWAIDEAQINDMLLVYQKNQLESNLPEQITRYMYAYRTTPTQQLRDYLQLLESDAYQSALLVWRNALEDALAKPAKV